MHFLIDLRWRNRTFIPTGHPHSDVALRIAYVLALRGIRYRLNMYFWLLTKLALTGLSYSYPSDKLANLIALIQARAAKNSYTKRIHAYIAKVTYYPHTACLKV